jgi:hypothetical protein
MRCLRGLLAAIAGLTLLTACGKPATSAAPVDDHWRIVADAFGVFDEFRTGPTVLLPEPGGCFVAFGRDSTGYGLISASWRASGDCTTTVPTRHTGGTGSGDGLPSQDETSVVAAVPVSPDGSDGYATLTRTTFHNDAFGYVTTVRRVGPDLASGSPTISFSDPHPDPRIPRTGTHVGPASIVRTPTGYLAAGYAGTTATVWASADQGATWTPTSLPDGDQQEANLIASPQIARGPSGQLVVVGFHQTTDDQNVIDAWHSEDGGHTWREGGTPALGGQPEVLRVLAAGTGFVAIGTRDPRSYGSALLLRSDDGVIWRQDTSIDDAGAKALSAATVLPDGSLVAFALTGTSAPRPADAPAGTVTACATAWIGPGTQWTHEDIGCHGVPEAALTLGDGRVVAARAGYLFVRAAAG